jgi:hypothetical protein
MRKTKIYLFVGALFVLLAVSLAFAQAGRSTAFKLVPTPIADQTPVMPLMGSPAIHPSIADAGPDTPAFTITDVVQYSNANNINGIWGYASLVRPTINKIEFLTDAEVQERIPSYTPGLVAGTLRCYVQYNGAFFLIPAPQAKPVPCPHAFEIFDAHTGNRIAYGVDPR